MEEPKIQKDSDSFSLVTTELCKNKVERNATMTFKIAPQANHLTSTISITTAPCRCQFDRRQKCTR